MKKITYIWPAHPRRLQEKKHLEQTQLKTILASFVVALVNASGVTYTPGHVTPDRVGDVL